MASRRGGAPPISLFSFQDIITSVTGIMVLITLLMSIELVQRNSKQPPIQTSTAHVDQLRSTIAEAQAEIEQLRARQQSSDKVLREAVVVSQFQLREESRELERLLERLETDAVDLKLQIRDTLLREENAQKIQNNEQRLVDELTNKLQELQSLIDKLIKENRVIYNPAKGNSKTAWLVEISSTRIMTAPLDNAASIRVFGQTTRQAEFLTWAKNRDHRQEYFVLLIKPSGIDHFLELQEKLAKHGFDLGFDLLAEDQTAIVPDGGLAKP